MLHFCVFDFDTISFGCLSFTKELHLTGDESCKPLGGAVCSRMQYMLWVMKTFYSCGRVTCVFQNFKTLLYRVQLCSTHVLGCQWMGWFVIGRFLGNLVVISRFQFLALIILSSCFKFLLHCLAQSDFLWSPAFMVKYSFMATLNSWEPDLPYFLISDVMVHVFVCLCIELLPLPQSQHSVCLCMCVCLWRIQFPSMC